jgi:hypothetical protein
VTETALQVVAVAAGIVGAAIVVVYLGGFRR